MVSESWSSASLSRAFLGATTFATRSYISIAITHLHKPSAAEDAFEIFIGSNSAPGRGREGERETQRERDSESERERERERVRDRERERDRERHTLTQRQRDREKVNCHDKPKIPQN